jgi:hypothetical protein
MGHIGCFNFFFLYSKCKLKACKYLNKLINNYLCKKKLLIIKKNLKNQEINID